MSNPTAAGERTQVLRREQDFHDALSAPLDAAAMEPRQPDLLETELLKRLGHVRGLRVLELGCGTGDLTLQLAGDGTVLTALDLSSGMVSIAQGRVKLFSPDSKVNFVVAPIEHSGLPDAAFDMVVGKWILHHADVAGAAQEIHRLLRPGGRAIFAENSALNPALSLARRFLVGRWGIPRYGTLDEHPLNRRDYQIFRRTFARTILSFPDFCFFQLFDRQVLRFRHQRWSRLLRGLDRAAELLPLVRRYSYHVVLELHR